MIPAPRLSFMWSAAMGVFGVVFWLYGVVTLLMPTVFAPHGYILAILGGLLALFFFLTRWLAGGSYCLYMGITGLRGWYETRHAPD